MMGSSSKFDVPQHCSLQQDLKLFKNKLMDHETGSRFRMGFAFSKYTHFNNTYLVISCGVMTTTTLVYIAYSTVSNINYCSRYFQNLEGSTNSSFLKLTLDFDFRLLLAHHWFSLGYEFLNSKQSNSRKAILHWG